MLNYVSYSKQADAKPEEEGKEKENTVGGEKGDAGSSNSTGGYSAAKVDAAKEHLLESDGLLKKLVDKFCKLVLNFSCWFLPIILPSI